MMARRLAARWVIPVNRAPIERGAVLIGTDGRITAVGPDAVVPRPHDTPAVGFDDAVILPGLINTHTHLELTGFAAQVPEREFAAWIRRLRELKTTRTATEYVAAARRGLAECYAAGVTTVADTGDSGAVIRVLAEAGGSGLAYQEVFGPHPDQLDESLSGLQERVRELAPLATGRVRIGVSPHAPYTVSGPLFNAVAGWARAERLPLAVHVAESQAETQFLHAGSGPFAHAWLARGIPLPPSGGFTPVRWLAEHGVLSERCLCIHAVQIDPVDIRQLADSGAAVAHCPLSNLAHDHGVAPLAALLEAGVRVGLGTDSEVSVGRPDLLAEARAAATQVGLSPGTVLELCTLGGARALGLERETGSLTPGKWGDCAVIQVVGDNDDPAEMVLHSSPHDVLGTYVGGREVYRTL
ncbi:MAG TPA: amidohydrolase family protein [Gemmatimonadales bacterium]|jgi:5-methylthioadenosine/S-adenosylhomocysteine deaminase|nr:amidohydrolase family protein [Gemmatimonadales bacterium]